MQSAKRRVCDAIVKKWIQDSSCTESIFLKNNFALSTLHFALTAETLLLYLQLQIKR